MNGRGLLSRKNPHTSFTQVAAFDSCCERYWYALYSRPPRRRPTRAMKDGDVIDSLLKDMVTLAKQRGAEQDVGMEEVEPLLEQYAAKFSSHGVFKRMSQGVRKYAERLNMRSIESGGYNRAARLNIVQAPFLLRAWVPVDGLKVALWGEIDRLDKNEREEPEIHEHKKEGVLISQADLEDDFQTDVYNYAYRQQHRYHGPMWKVWHSIGRGIKLYAAATVEDADDTKRRLQSVLRRMFRCLETKKFARTVNRRCDECPEGAECDAWRAERRGGVEGPLPATLKTYHGLRTRVAALNAAKDRVGQLVRVRIETEGGILDEEGFHGELRTYPPKLDERFLIMSREQLLEELRTPGSTRLVIKPVPKKKGR